MVSIKSKCTSAVITFNKFWKRLQTKGYGRRESLAYNCCHMSFMPLTLAVKSRVICKYRVVTISPI